MIEIKQQRFNQVTDRQCNNCTACCVWLGIEELKKYTGNKCKHLRGPAYTNKHCSIYHNRPSACSEYKCLWRTGWGLDDWQPNKSGILISIYLDEVLDKLTVTMTIFDEVKAKNYVNEISAQLILIPEVVEVRVINYKTKKALLYKNGSIYDCQLLPQDSYESLSFMAEDTPIGSYQIK